jgi:hypothetical protein
VGAEERVQGVVEFGLRLQVGKVADAIDDDQLGPLQACGDLAGYRLRGPRVRRPGQDQRGDVERCQQRPVVRPFGPAAQRRRGTRGRGCGHHCVDAGADSGRAGRTVQAGVHVVHQDAHAATLDRLGTRVPDAAVIR